MTGNGQADKVVASRREGCKFEFSQHSSSSPLESSLIAAASFLKYDIYRSFVNEGVKNEDEETPSVKVKPKFCKLS